MMRDDDDASCAIARARDDDDDDDRAAFLPASPFASSSSTHDNENAANARSRTPRDVNFGRAFAACAALCALGGVVGAARSRGGADALDALTSEALGRYESCHASDGTGTRRRRALLSSSSDDAFAARETPAAVAVSVGAIALGVVALRVFQKHPRAATWGMIWMESAFGVVFGASLVANGGVVAGVILIAFSVFFACWMLYTRDRVELVAKLLAAASTALRDNPHLVTASTFAGVGLCASVVVVGLCAFFAAMNGSIVPYADEDVVHRDGSCYWADDLTTPVDCCAWEMDAWVPPFLSFASLVARWVALFFDQARNYVVGGTVSRWYFAPSGTVTFAGTTREFIGHAWHTSFGSLAFGALVLAAVSVMRQINERARRRSEGFMAVLACIVTSIMDCIGEIIEALTRFATIQCAISGDDLCTAGREVTRLLNDNFLSAVRVWWLPEMVLGLAAFFLALAYSTVATFVFGLTTSLERLGVDGYGQVVFLSAFASSWIVLSFFSNILLSCVDAVFICYAIDKDRNMLTKPDIVAVYDEVTAKTRPVENLSTQTTTTTTTSSRPGDVGRVFTQPGATIVYGRPSGDNDNL